MDVGDVDASNFVEKSKNISNLRGVTMGRLNICSLIRKHDDVVALLSNSKLDYLGICESWLK